MGNVSPHGRPVMANVLRVELHAMGGVILQPLRERGSFFGTEVVGRDTASMQNNKC